MTDTLGAMGATGTVVASLPHMGGHGQRFTKSPSAQDIIKFIPVQDIIQFIPVQDIIQFIPVQDIVQFIPIQDII